MQRVKNKIPKEVTQASGDGKEWSCFRNASCWSWSFKNNAYICVFLRHNETSYWKKQLKIFGEDSVTENGGTGTVIFFVIWDISKVFPMVNKWSLVEWLQKEKSNPSAAAWQYNIFTWKFLVEYDRYSYWQREKPILYFNGFWYHFLFCNRDRSKMHWSCEENKIFKAWCTAARSR